jgi:hypothetical protein
LQSGSRSVVFVIPRPVVLVDPAKRFYRLMGFATPAPLGKAKERRSVSISPGTSAVVLIRALVASVPI